jgi:hypothetical protein
MLRAGERLKLMRRLERDWGGAVSGKLGQPTDNGFEVVDAGIKVFEKKANVPKPEETTIGADAAPIV